ncbi:MAG: HEAT repeat domain-containing protein [Phycisphaerales bacterium]|nr:MAG: HEAT repeat domain-containing protein [Phycisphaerales bacterium]
MRKKHIWIAAGVVVLALIGVWAGVRILKGERDSVTLGMWVERPRYKLGDEIPVRLVIKNRGRSDFPGGSSRSSFEKIPYIGRFFRRRPSTVRYQPGVLVSKADGSLCVRPGLYSGFSAWGPWTLTRLKAQQSKTIRWLLNEHALIGGPGVYRVVGVIVETRGAGLGSDVAFRSEPIEVIIEGRSVEEMGRYIEKLEEELEAATDPGQKGSVMRRLVYTRDRRIVPELLDWEYGRSDRRLVPRMGSGYGEIIGNYTGGDSGMLCDAFEGYLPIEPQTQEIALRAAQERGLTGVVCRALERFGCGEEQWKELIAGSLASETSRFVKAAALAAVEHPDDSHTPRLIELAEDPNGEARGEAILALARNRTDEGVETLGKLLIGQDLKIRQITMRALRYAPMAQPAAVVRTRGAQGSCAPVIAAAKDAGNPQRWEVIRRLMGGLYREDVAAIEQFLSDPSRKEAAAGRGEIVKALVELMGGRDKDVADRVVTIMRAAHKRHPGRPFRPEDFARPKIQAQ